MKKEKTKVVVADDHQLFIEGLKALLKDTDEIQLVGEAENGKMLLDLLETKLADVVLMDIKMPVMDGIEATKKVKELYPHIKVLALTMHDDPIYISEILKVGASGYLLKNTGKEELISAIKKVQAGEKFLSHDVSAKLIEQMFSADQPSMSGGSTMGGNGRKPDITKRELEIIKLIAQEMTNTEIAAKLNNSPMTIITHRKNLLRKLGVKNTAGLIRYAVQNGLLDEK